MERPSCPFLNKGEERGVKVNLMDHGALKTHLLDGDGKNTKARVFVLCGIIVCLSARDTRALYEVGLYSMRSECLNSRRCSEISALVDLKGSHSCLSGGWFNIRDAHSKGSAAQTCEGCRRVEVLSRSTRQQLNTTKIHLVNLPTAIFENIWQQKHKKT